MNLAMLLMKLRGLDDISEHAWRVAVLIAVVILLVGVSGAHSRLDKIDGKRK